MRQSLNNFSQNSTQFGTLSETVRGTWQDSVGDAFYRDIIHMDGIVELMCHPGHASYQKETDYLMATSEWRNGIQILSYNDLT